MSPEVVKAVEGPVVSFMILQSVSKPRLTLLRIPPAEKFKTKTKYQKELHQKTPAHQNRP
jgi:hypothetical protein